MYSYPVSSQASLRETIVDVTKDNIASRDVSRLHRSSLKVSSQLAKGKLFATIHKEKGFLKDVSHVSNAHFKGNSIAIGFPVVQLVARNDSLASTGSLLSSVVGAPAQHLSMSKEGMEFMRFSSPEDPDFQRIIVSLKTALEARRLLVAEALADCNEISGMMNSHADPNMRDRW